MRTDGDWEAGSRFFLEGVDAAATEAERGIVAIASLVAADRRRLLAAPRVGAVRAAAVRVAAGDAALHHRAGAPEAETTFPTATAAVKLLEDLGIVGELTGQKKNRSFSYRAYVELLSR